MAGVLYSTRYTKTGSDTFPVVETVNLSNAIAVQIVVSGNNAVDYLFVNSGNSGRLTNKDVFQVSNSDSITDQIDLTFNAPATVEVIWTDGISGSAAGGATAANQLIIIDFLNGTTTSVLSGNVEQTSLIEYLASGFTDNCLSCSILFEGTGGFLDGVAVEDGFVASFSGTLRNEILAISFDVPTAPGISGNQRVLVSYTKI